MCGLVKSVIVFRILLFFIHKQCQGPLSQHTWPPIFARLWHTPGAFIFRWQGENGGVSSGSEKRKPIGFGFRPRPVSRSCKVVWGDELQWTCHSPKIVKLFYLPRAFHEGIRRRSRIIETKKANPVMGSNFFMVASYRIRGLMGRSRISCEALADVISYGTISLERSISMRELLLSHHKKIPNKRTWKTVLNSLKIHLYCCISLIKSPNLLGRGHA